MEGQCRYPAGVDADRNWVKIECGSGTGDEYPTVADIDGDGEAEILTVGHLPPNASGNSDYRGRLWVFESDGLPWPSARPIWNQFGYNGLNINDDLTVPRNLQAHHLEFPNLGSGKRPFNGATVQVPIFDSDFDAYLPAPDAVVQIDSSKCGTDSMTVWLTICKSRPPVVAGQPLYFFLSK